MSWKLSVKSHLATVLQHAGGFRLLNTLYLHNAAFVLMYHRVLPLAHEGEVFVQPGMYVSLEAFRHQMDILKTQYHVLPLWELVQRIETGESVGGCCAITFDDGWQDNYTHAYPILKELNVPATIFLATGFIGTSRLFWPEEVAFYLHRLDVLGQDHNHPLLASLPSDCSTTRDEQIDHVIMALKNIDPQRREELLVDLRTRCQENIPPAPLLMNWKEVQEMVDSGLVDFGAHSHNHVILDQVPFAQAENEIRQSRQEMEQHLGGQPMLFAYPNGNFSPALKELVRMQGFKGAVTTRKGWVGTSCDLFEIPRIGMHQDISRTIPLFQARMLCRWF